MKWFVTVWENAKTHVTPEPLQDKLVENLKLRGCIPIDDTPLSDLYGPWCHEVHKAGIALGGARRANESIIDFEIDSLQFGFFVRDVEIYYSVLQELPVRLELGQEYYKLHGDLHCICLLPRQKEELLRQIKERLPEIRALEAIETEKWNKIVDSLNKSPYVKLSKRAPKNKVSSRNN